MSEIDELLVELRGHERVSGARHERYGFSAAERSRAAAFKCDVGIRFLVASIEAQRDAAVDACRDARSAIASLPVDALGEGHSVERAPDGECDVMAWPLRDELLDKINRAIHATEEVTP